ncbi:hypothetical protein BDP27DRAFT_1320219 [Rhodocollybia butyracea]|uniref:Uncharacterized protein n=1 Tax=Rhodocollybia butyracea TaxID=206335 RepID=A0A9P5Q0T8_9AGAR|nr:hypothetical protein BDP27DRAFT_1320219 [Rhodocollybia butyracea]
MMEALRKCFKCDENTTFFGTYHVQNAPEVIDKQRIQIVVHEILIATGYRFTVKDHPPAKNGHTTRLWCSQDIQRKNRNLNPRVSASGETMAKQRFPCRSRLLVSSRDAEVSGYKIITVRMYHHVQHEPYRDSSYPPLALRAIGASADDVSVQDRETETFTSKYSISASSSTLPPHPIHVNPLITIGQLQSRFATSQSPDMDSQPNALASPNFSFHISVETFQQRMRTHIQNIRDFCDGLEYQVQFNDTRMLQELEERGNGFLEYVKECLDREGRLRAHEEREKEHDERGEERDERREEHDERREEHDERGEGREEHDEPEEEEERERGQSVAAADTAINDSIADVS